MGKTPISSYDLTALREASGCDIRGVLGMQFLKDWIITIDFDEGRLDFLPPRTAKQPEWGKNIPFEYGSTGIPRVHATLGKDIESSFAVDTGDSGTGNIDEAFLMLLVGLNEARMTGIDKNMTLSGPHSSDAARLSRLTIGSFRHENLRFTGGKQDDLGLRYLSRYRVTIDFQNRQLYLAEGK